MNFTSPADVLNLPISYKEKHHNSRDRLGYHVYLSQYFLRYKQLSYDEKCKIMVDNGVWGENTEDDDNISIDSVLTPQTPTSTDVMKAAGFYWSNTIDERMKDAWKERANLLNRRPNNNGVFTEIPSPISELCITKAIVESLSIDWMNFAKLLKGCIVRNRRGASFSEDGRTVYRFGKERIVLQSQTQRSFSLNLLLKFTIFGSSPLFSNLLVHEITYRSKHTTVLHLLSSRRMGELFTFGGLDATVIHKRDGTKQKCCAKVSMEKGNKSVIGYVIDEDETNLVVKVEGMIDTVTIMRPRFEVDQYIYPSAESGDTYSLSQLWPIRIKLNQLSGYSSIIMSAATFNDCNNLVTY